MQKYPKCCATVQEKDSRKLLGTSKRVGLLQNISEYSSKPDLMYNLDFVRLDLDLRTIAWKYRSVNLCLLVLSLTRLGCLPVGVELAKQLLVTR